MKNGQLPKEATVSDHLLLDAYHMYPNDTHRGGECTMIHRGLTTDMGTNPSPEVFQWNASRAVTEGGLGDCWPRCVLKQAV